MLARSTRARPSCPGQGRRAQHGLVCSPAVCARRAVPGGPPSPLRRGCGVRPQIDPTAPAPLALALFRCRSPCLRRHPREQSHARAARLVPCAAVQELHLKALYAHFLALADTSHAGGSSGEAPHISKKGFLKALGAEEGSSLFIERVFTCMDGNRDGFLNFLEFVMGLDLLSPEATAGERLRLLFDVYDIDGDGLVSKTECRALLAAAFVEAGVTVPPTDLQKVVDKTFEAHDLDHDGNLSFTEFQTMADKRPGFLRPVTLHTKQIIDQHLAKADGTGAAGASASSA